MSRPLITIHNADTDEIETREMNDTELAAYEAEVASATAEAQAQAKAETDKAALLAKLGITADEAKLLLS
jgi:hypothetical protein